MTLTELADYLRSLPELLRQSLDRELRALTPVWVPIPGSVQQRAFESEADVLYFGGGAGVGKTDLVAGLALTKHRRSIIFRREGTQLSGIVERLTEILGGRDGFSGQGLGLWRLDDRVIEFGACKDLGDEQRYMGRPHDLKAFDEVPFFLEHQFRFLCGWLRTEDPNQRCRVVCTGNPPLNSDGDWVIEYWGPWLDPRHPNKAEHGELRWYAMVDGKEIAVPDATPLEQKGEVIHPKSRTFIGGTVKDNPHYVRSGYTAQLQSLWEPLRSQLLYGDFTVRYTDDARQVCPTEWVEAAMSRWTADGSRQPMDSVGVDVARGGKDETIIARRHGWWFDELVCRPGRATPDGPAVAGEVVAVVRDHAPVHVDIVGIGASVYDHLKGINVHTVGMNGAEGTEERDASKQMTFYNRRALWWWRMREALDPVRGQSLALPPDPKLKADLCAPRFEVKPRGLLIESKEDLVERLGRSPDRGDAVVYALNTTAKRGGPTAKGRPRSAVTEHNPFG